MAIDLGGQLRWAGATAEQKAMLCNLQANILTGHVRDQMWVLFFRFDDGRDPARRFVRAMAERVKSMWAQLDQYETHKLAAQPGRPYVGLGLSSSGYDRLGLDAERPADPAFIAGMKGRAEELGDAPDEWHETYRHCIDAVVILGDALGRSLTALRRQIEGDARGRATLLFAEIGGGQRPRAVTKEPFGFDDGLSQPIYLEDELERLNRGAGFRAWNPGSPLRTILVPDPGVADPAVRDVAFGTYLVYRKLRQNVEEFTRYLRRVRRQISSDAGALVVGRSRDGRPLGAGPTNASSGAVPRARRGDNDFTYDGDPDGHRCPVHAHVRVMNDRTDADRAHVIARRGQSYGTADWAAVARGRVQDSTEAGLLFMAMNADIADQFEFLQQRANGHGGQRDRRPRGPVPVGDDLIGRGVPVRREYPARYGDVARSAPTEPVPDGAVTMRGGEYFFVPSIAFLRRDDW
jgi:Dyp-type peroxidase family